MLKNLGIVQACFHSPRFRCNAMRKFAGRSLLEWVIRRVTDSMQLDGVIVVACATELCHDLRRLVPFHLPKVTRWALVVLVLVAGLGFVPEYRSKNYLKKKAEEQNIKDIGKQLVARCLAGDEL